MHEMRKFLFGDRSNVAPHVKERRHQEKIYFRERIGLAELGAERPTRWN